MYEYNTQDFERLAEIRLSVGSAIEQITHTAVERAGVPMARNAAGEPDESTTYLSVNAVRAVSPVLDALRRFDETSRAVQARFATGQTPPSGDLRLLAAQFSELQVNFARLSQRAQGFYEPGHLDPAFAAMETAEEKLKAMGAPLPAPGRLQ